MQIFLEKKTLQSKYFNFWKEISTFVAKIFDFLLSKIFPTL